MRTRFRGFDIMAAKCPRHVTAGYMVCVSDDQWKYVASKRHTFVFLQPFDSPCCLDVSVEGGGVLPAPECRLVISSSLICLLELCRGCCSGSTVTRALSKLDISVVTALAIDWLDVCVMTNHTIGRTKLRRRA